MKIWKGNNEKVTCTTACIRFPGLREELYWGDLDAVPFIYSRDLEVLVTGTSDEIHWDLFTKHGINSSFGNNFIAGRLWVDRRIVTFYSEETNPFPSSREFVQVAKKLSQERYNISDYTLIIELGTQHDGSSALVEMSAREYINGGYGGYEDFDDFMTRCKSVDFIDVDNPEKNKQPGSTPSKLDRFPGEDEYSKLQNMRQWNGYSDVAENRKSKKIIVSENQLRVILKEIASAEIDERAKDVDLTPTDAQKEAGNYKMAHISVRGMEISIENPRGSYRSYRNEDGSKGYVLMHNHYGYFNITKGKDGDAVDVFIGPHIDDFENVYCVDQNKVGGHHGVFDETKVMLGFLSKEEAKKAYLSNYSKGWTGFRAITGVSLKVFKKWLYRGRKQRQPFADYVYIQKRKLKEARIANQSQYEAFRKEVERIKERIRSMDNSGGKPRFNGHKFELGNYGFMTLVNEYLVDGPESFVRKAVARAIYEYGKEQETNYYNQT